MAVLAVLWQIIFHYVFFLKLVQFKSLSPIEQDLPPVSVIICAKNERHNLSQNLPAFLSQDYPHYEVIVVNDASWDGTDELLSIFSDQYANLRVVEVGEEIKRIEGKKFPLTMGIKAAHNPVLLLSDADCKPLSNQWIKAMAGPYVHNPNIEIVLGYSPYELKNSVLNFFIRAETSLTAMLYTSFALAHKPYMGVGRNLSYKRDLFFKHKGFASHHHIPAGDDDLFVRDAATKTNTAVVIEPRSRVLSSPKTQWKKWFQQKKRHLFVGKFYNPGIQSWLSSFALSHFLCWSLCLALFFWVDPMLPSILIAAKWILVWPVVLISFKKLGYRYLGLFLPVMDLAYLFYSLFGGLVYVFSKKPKW